MNLESLFRFATQTIICDNSSKKAKLEIFERISKRGCSSEKEHKVNALALGADEGRDYLR